MPKPTADMTKAELVQYLVDKWYPSGSEQATKQYGAMTKHQLLEQVEHARGERATSDLTYRYDH
jgi:hypothetical protein